MILSDLNRDHGLILPKLTDLDLDESLFEYNEDPVLLKTAFYSYRPTEFNVAYDKYVSKVTSQVKLNSNQLTILKSQSSRIKKIAAGYFQSCNNQVTREDIPTSDLYSSFDSDGCAGFKFNPGEVDSLLASCLNDVTTLQNQPDRNTSPTKHDAYDRIKVLDNTHATFKLLNKILKRHSVYDVVSKYNRAKTNLKLDTVALHVARPNDTHHYQTLADIPGKPKTISFHMDPKFNVMKAIVYLNNVTESNGPFTTIPKSNRWYHPEFDRIIACGNSVGNYLSSPDHRLVMSLFPDCMTRNVIMGKYFKDGGDMSNLLMSSMHKYTSDQADCILFDPAHTIHRGGLCDDGERINLQIIMR
tara:strand:+ start:1262 stop:2335 length:1074 start_codon:yes stop_codon:yes gene_type:complete